MTTSVQLPDEPDRFAPDGAEVRGLVRLSRGSMAHFTLQPGETSVAKQHRDVEELWYFVSGSGQMCVGDDVCDVGVGTSVAIPSRTRFQFRASSEAPLSAVGVTMPPWPDADEAQDAPPKW